MIVTADPLGDYNATSQILRYSALAREVTVPRVPSLTESILSSTLGSCKGAASGRNSPNLALSEELEKAVAEIARLTSENETLAVRLAEEEIMRAELEMRLKSSEEKCLLIEQEVREECWADMDGRMEEERKRWQNAFDEQVRIRFLGWHLTASNTLRLAAMMNILIRRLNCCLVASKVRTSPTTTLPQTRLTSITQCMKTPAQLPISE